MPMFSEWVAEEVNTTFSSVEPKYSATLRRHSYTVSAARMAIRWDERPGFPQSYFIIRRVSAVTSRGFGNVVAALSRYTVGGVRFFIELYMVYRFVSNVYCFIRRQADRCRLLSATVLLYPLFDALRLCRSRIPSRFFLHQVLLSLIGCRVRLKVFLPSLRASMSEVV